jgi:hypothetical protein
MKDTIYYATCRSKSSKLLKQTSVVNEEHSEERLPEHFEKTTEQNNFHKNLTKFCKFCFPRFFLFSLVEFEWLFVKEKKYPSVS